MLEILYYSLKAIQPVLPYICFLCAWWFVLTLGWGIFTAVADAVARGEQMHKRPCSNCQYFTNDFRLKCTVQPSIANTEKAIGCLDYHPSNKIY